MIYQKLNYIKRIENKQVYFMKIQSRRCAMIYKESSNDVDISNL